MKKLFLLAALPALLLAAPVDDADARPRCRPGKKLLVSKGTCVSPSAFRAEIREARRSESKATKKKDKREAKPVVCRTNACVAQQEKAMTTPVVASAGAMVVPAVMTPAVEAEPEVVVCETEACVQEQDRADMVEKKQIDEMLMRDALQVLRDKMPRQ